MTVKTLCDELGWTVLTEGDLSREITGCYCGDLLSWVMSKAQDGDCWLTVMGNINAVAVAVLTDCACIVLTENAALDDEAAYGAVLRAKGVVPATEGEWLHFDHVPGEVEVRRGPAGVIGRLCVIGSKLNEAALKTLFSE